MSEINSNSWLFQVMVIIVVSMIPVGCYYGMDSPAPIENNLKNALNKTTTIDGKEVVIKMEPSDFTFLWEIYSIPNIFLCFVAGIFIDSQWGRRKGSLICCSIVATGAAIVAYGAYINSLVVMYFGRFFFGIGSESVALCEYSYNNYWFDTTKVKEGSSYKPKVSLEFAFAIAISFSRGSTAIAFETLGRAYNYFAGVDTKIMETQTEWAAAQNSQYGEITYNKLDFDREDKNLDPNYCMCTDNKSIADKAKAAFCVVNTCSPDELKNNEIVPIEIHLNDTAQAAGKTLAIPFLVAVASLIMAAILAQWDILGNRYRKRTQANHTKTEEEMKLKAEEGLENNENTENVNDDDDGVKKLSFAGIFSAVKEVNIAAWLVMFVCMFYYMAVFPFVGQGTEFFTTYRGVETDQARTLTMLILALSGFGVAAGLGVLIGKVHSNAIFVLIGTGLTCLGHIALLIKFINFNNWAIVIMMGIGYSFVAGALWPLLSYNVAASISSTCYGIMQSLQLLGLFISFRISGIIRAVPENLKAEIEDKVLESKRLQDLDALNVTNYRNLQFYFCCISGLAVVLTCVLIVNKGIDGYERKKEEEK